jgi:hypothetical protein
MIREESLKILHYTSKSNGYYLTIYRIGGAFVFSGYFCVNTFSNEDPYSGRRGSIGQYAEQGAERGWV